MKAELKSPAFQFYPNDFLGSAKVAAMTLEEVGLYTLLLCYDWNEVGLPECPELLAKLLRISPRTFKKLWRTVGENFTKRGNRYYNKRLDAERRKQLERKKKAADAANQRWHPDEDANALPEAMPTQSPSFTSSTPSPTNNSLSLSAEPKKREPEQPPAWPYPVRDFLSRRENQGAWAAALVAMQKGLGTPGGKAVTTEHIAQACLEIEQLGGEISPRRFRRVLEQIIEPAGGKRGSADDAEFVKASKRLQEIASYRDPVRTQALSVEGWKIVTPKERDALKAIGTIERVLTAKPDQWGFVVRDFLKAQRGAAA